MSESIQLDKHEMVVDKDDYEAKTEALEFLILVKNYGLLNGEDDYYKANNEIAWQKVRNAIGLY